MRFHHKNVSNRFLHSRQRYLIICTYIYAYFHLDAYSFIFYAFLGGNKISRPKKGKIYE